MLAWGTAVHAQTGCLVKLKNGREIKTQNCFEKDDQVYTYRYGGYVVYPKSEVAEITSIDAGGDSTPSPQKTPRRLHFHLSLQTPLLQWRSMRP